MTLQTPARHRRPRRPARRVGPASVGIAVVSAVAMLLAGPGGCAGSPETLGSSAGDPAALDERIVDAPPVYRRAAIATDHKLASEAGRRMLEQDGNAVDAAVAASFALSVVRPYSCGIGGGGFMVIHIPDDDGRGEQIVINYRETAPEAVGPDYFLDRARDDASRYGPHAAGVPGTVAGLLHALEQHGSLDRQTVLAPAIEYAEQGVPVDANHVKAMQQTRELLDRRPDLRDHASYIRNVLCGGGGGLSEGDVIRQPRKAEALRLIAEDGRDAFYTGPIADAVAETVQQHGGPITRADLAGYEIDVTTPLVSTFQGQTILAMPPPSSGGVAMQQILGILDRRLGAVDADTPFDVDYAHLLIESFKHAFADRAEHLADARFVDVPVDELTAPSYLDELADRIDMSRVLDPYDYGSAVPAADDAGTSHLSVIDGDGMAVACTETINLVFGSLVAVDEFGIVLNNEMNDFTTIPGAPNAFGLRQSDRNLPEPGKRPLSSMSPTIVLDEAGAVRIVAGASGGPRIITATMQCMLNAILFDYHARQAVESPRLHHQWMPMTLRVERDWADRAIRENLRARGHIIEEVDDSLAAVQMLRVGPFGIEAWSDSRKGGAPAGR